MLRKLFVVAGLIVLGLVIFNFEALSAYFPSFFSGSSSFNQLKRLQNSSSQNSSEFEFRGSAMEPSLQDGDICVLDKGAYGTAVPSRGDIVLFTGKSGVGKDIELVKRIIGLPLERVIVRGGKVLINGTILAEPYLPSTGTTPAGKFLQEGVELVIPSNHYFLLGDNRMHSSDSREFGFIDLFAIHGKILSCRTP